MWRIILLLEVLLMGTYLLRTPDGWEFEFDQAQFAVDPGLPDGFGLPPVQHQVQTVFHRPGQILQDIAILPRIVTITAKINGTCLEELHALRCKLWNALRWNRTLDDPPAASQFVYREVCGETTLNCYYIGDTTEDIGTDEKRQASGIRLVAYDPLWKGTAHEQALAAITAFTGGGAVARVNGVWGNLAGGSTGSTGAATVRVVSLSPDNSKLYIGGTFLNWAGNGALDYFIVYDFNTATYSTVGTVPDGEIRDLKWLPDGRFVVAGAFANIGGIAASRVAIYDPVTGLWSALGAGVNSTVERITLSPDSSIIYVTGGFTTAGGGGANYVAQYTIATGAWAAMGTGLAGGGPRGYGLATAPDGKIYVCGTFTSAGGVSAANIAVWNPVTSAWAALSSGVNGTSYNVAIGADGAVYVSGNFTTAGGISANDIARWNGSAFTPLGAGATGGTIFGMGIGEDGLIYVTGSFTSIGGLAVAARGAVAAWDGSLWAVLDLQATTGPQMFSIQQRDNILVIGMGSPNTGDSFLATYQNTVNTAGDMLTFPTFTITGPGTLAWIQNVTANFILQLNLTLAPGEVATIDLTAKTMSSNFRGNLLPYAALLPMSDFASFALEPHPIAANGDNVISLLMTGTTPSEQGDNNNQLSGWANITGVTYLNTDSNGAIYVTIVDDGGGFYHVNLYDDAARTHLVGHTASYNSNGAKAVVPDNSSGLGGTITVDARTAADTDIIVYFATIKAEWTDQFLSADCAVMCGQYLPLIGITP